MIRLALRLDRADAELVLAELLELVPAGVEERELEDGRIEYAIYGAPGELPLLPDLRAAAGGALVEVSSTDVADDWSERWRSFHRPALVEPPADVAAQTGDRAVPALWLRPPWEPPRERNGLLDVVIDPGQAFGTGAHATTRLCLELLLAVAAHAPPGALIDLGTGSGVLAIAAARLGYGPVLALDNDPVSVSAARANADANGVAIAVRRFDLRRDGLPAMERTVLVANLLAPLLHDLARRLGAVAADREADPDPAGPAHAPAHLVAGGLLVEQVDDVAAAFAELNLRERARRRRGEWAAVWLARGAA
jgi:ribosomal protein L11 methyltransferase